VAELQGHSLSPVERLITFTLEVIRLLVPLQRGLTVGDSEVMAVPDKPVQAVVLLTLERVLQIYRRDCWLQAAVGVRELITLLAVALRVDRAVSVELVVELPDKPVRTTLPLQLPLGVVTVVWERAEVEELKSQEALVPETFLVETVYLVSAESDGTEAKTMHQVAEVLGILVERVEVCTVRGVVTVAEEAAEGPPLLTQH
jgi:hypothetical protein